MAHVLSDVLASAKRVATEICERDAEIVDRESRWPEAAMRSLQREGLGGLVVPTSMGGLGQGLLGLAHVSETLGHACPSTAICFGMHQVGAAVIASKATRYHIDNYLAPIVAGEHITTLALSEPGSGAHFYYPQARMVAHANDYVVTGAKAFVTNGGQADSYVISTQAAESEPTPGTFSCALVPNEGPGISWGDPWDGLGMRGNSSRSLRLDNVRFGREDRLGEEGDQTWYVFQVVAPYFLVAMAGTYLGLATRALDETVERLKTRRYQHSGTSPARVGILQHRIGELWVSLERSRRLIYWAAIEADAGGTKAIPALCAAKADIAIAATTIVNECMTLNGGKDYESGSVVSRLLRDARAAHVMSPTTDILMTWIGRSVLGLPLLDDEPASAASAAPPQSEAPPERGT